jgi:hypothetical protein
VTTYPASGSVADASAQRGEAGGRRHFHDRRLSLKLFAVVGSFMLVFAVVLGLAASSLVRFNNQENAAASQQVLEVVLAWRGRPFVITVWTI